MEQSNRNQSRTNDRNEEAFENFAALLVGVGKTGFYYQYCNNPKCREMEVLILPQRHGADDHEVRAFRQVVEVSQVPGVILSYPDGVTLEAVYIGAQGYSNTTVTTWDEFVVTLWNKHIAHESANPACAQYNHQLLPEGRWRSPDHDVLFSNHARRVPGVRHIDTDGVLYCEDCYVPLFVVEASTDGCPGTPMAGKYKATTMTRAVAKMIDAAPALIQHHYHDAAHEHPVYLTTWKTGTQRRFDRTWELLAQDFKNAFDQHKAGGCRRT